MKVAVVIRCKSSGFIFGVTVVDKPLVSMYSVRDAGLAAIKVMFNDDVHDESWVNNTLNFTTGGAAPYQTCLECKTVDYIDLKEMK